MVNLRRGICIPTNQIIMLEGAGNYTIVHLRHQQKQLYAKSICAFEKMLLPEGFIRVHRSFIINTQWVLNYDSDKCFILLCENLQAPVSRRKKERFETLFGNP
jgi:two-component system LytT family response regulator